MLSRLYGSLPEVLTTVLRRNRDGVPRLSCYESTAGSLRLRDRVATGRMYTTGRQHRQDHPATTTRHGHMNPTRHRSRARTSRGRARSPMFPGVAPAKLGARTLIVAGRHGRNEDHLRLTGQLLQAIADG